MLNSEMIHKLRYRVNNYTNFYSQSDRNLDKLLLDFLEKENDRTDQFDALRNANVRRDQQWDPKGKLSLLFRSTELGGECGELLGKIKKWEREILGLKGSRVTLEDIEEEVADVMICLDLLCMELDIDIWKVTKKKFNSTSEKIGLQERL